MVSRAGYIDVRVQCNEPKLTVTKAFMHDKLAKAADLADKFKAKRIE